MKRICITAVLVILISLTVEISWANSPEKVWIYFKDKGGQSDLYLSKPTRLVSSRSLQRRARALPMDERVDYYDVPVYGEYIRRLEPYLIKLRHHSRWLNAVSAEIDAGRADEILALDFVNAIEPLHVSRQRIPQPQEEEIPALSKISTRVADLNLNYGASYTQLEQIHVPELHRKGVFGQGVLICMLDSGYKLWQQHEAFDSLDVIATWDFVEGNEDVTDHSHGNYTLSAIGGYAPGNLIGPAFKASYLLARTEVAATETPSEEDNWVAGIEWADSMGADIVSSSLGYNEFDPGYEDYNYRYRDLDGKTAVTTIAAEIAADKGILVFNSAGNEYAYSWHYIITPADGERVMAVAAVWDNGVRAPFSSVGPTADGRIKPDIAAMGVSVVLASQLNPTAYVRYNGTSFSCPLAAGVGAQLLSAYPEATPEDIRQALKLTASQAANPDTALGYGIINAAAAYNYLGGNLDTGQPLTVKEISSFPNPLNNTQANIKFNLSTFAEIKLTLFNTLGQKVYTKNFGFYGDGDQKINYNLPASLPSGMYFIQLSAEAFQGRGTSFGHGKMVLLH